MKLRKSWCGACDWLNRVTFDPRYNYKVSLYVFWISCFLAPVTMVARAWFSGLDLFEQVLLAISWYAIIETARNSVITSLIDNKTDEVAKSS